MIVRVLLRFSHGLGDTVQFSVILKHLRQYRPDWQVTVRCGRGKHSALAGLCHRVLHDQEPEPPKSDFDTVLDIMWYENYNAYPNRPNSKVTNCLHEVFGLEWKEQFGQYTINLEPKECGRAIKYLESIGCKQKAIGRYNAVVLHYEGNTSPDRKNLAHWQADEICRAILDAGRVPVILDWDNRSPLPDQQRIFRPACGKGDMWGGFGSGDAATIAALVQFSEAYVGVDSGPGKCASSTTTPTFICWTGHHPIQFHDPAPTTVHLIPANHRRMEPCVRNPAIADWFEKNYNFQTYADPKALPTLIRQRLFDLLCRGQKVEEMQPKKRYVLPNGIGDVTWALLKIHSIAGDEPLDIVLAGDPGREIDRRSVPYLQRFDFVREVKVLDVPILQDTRRWTDAEGRYRYVADGERDGFHFLVPNAILEKGKRIETWHPDEEIDWNVMDHFSWKDTERGTEIGKAMKPFAAFYLGPESGHTDEGHNWGWRWEPKQWIELAGKLRQRGLDIALVGAEYDRSFWERYVRFGVEEAGQEWYDWIGKLEIGETLALLKEASVFVSYQCGLGIVAHYLGVPVVMWWRKDGDSLHPEQKVCFHEEMRNAWVRPDFENRYLGCVYGRESVDDIIGAIDERGWLACHSST